MVRTETDGPLISGQAIFRLSPRRTGAHSHPSLMKTRISRRSFIQRSGTGTTALLAFPAIVSGQNANSKLNIAIIGSGGRGGSNLKDVSSENIVALCDVHEPYLNAAAQKHPNARKYIDFRKL